MSTKAVAAVLSSPPQREYTDRLVLVALAERADRDSASCRPGLKRLARDAGMPYRTAQDAVARLEADGWVTVHRRPGHGSHYVLNLEHLNDPEDPNDWCDTCWDLANDPARPRPWDPDWAPVETATTGTVTVPPDPHGDRATPTRQAVPPPHGGPCQGDTVGRARTVIEPSGEPSTNMPPTGGAPTHDDLVEAIAEACGYPPDRHTKPIRDKLALAARWLADVDATTVQVHDAARRYRREWPELELTPMALAHHWARFTDGHPRQDPTRDPTDAAIELATAWSALSWDDVAEGLQAFPDQAVDAAREAWQHAQHEGAAA